MRHEESGMRSESVPPEDTALGCANRAKDEFVALDATAQAELVRKGEVCSAELVEAAIARIERLNPIIGAVIHPRFAQARREARRRDARRNELVDGAFTGVPYLIKDMEGVKGEPLEYGSRLFRGNVARRDLGSVARAKEAGVVILGKSTTAEFGLLPTTEPLLHAATRNPWDLTKHAGGSSGGAGAAVAAGMVPFAHASDGGGSIRNPASNCGLVGLKPSRGRLHKVWAEDSILDVDIICRLGITRSVRDTAQLLNISERKESTARYAPVGMIACASKKRLRIAMSTVNPVGVPAHPDVRAAIERTAALCESLGHEVIEAKFPADGEEFLECFLTIFAAVPSKLARMARLLGLMQLKWRTADDLEPWALGLAKWLSQKEAEKPGAMRRALANVAKFEAMYKAFFERFDVELTPVLRTPPLTLGHCAPDVEFDTLFERVLDYVGYTPQHNAAGTPAISLPLFTSSEGLPIGSQFAAGPGREQTLLELAYELEEALPWADRWAPHSAHSL